MSKEIILINAPLFYIICKFFSRRFITGFLYCDGLLLMSVRQLRIHDAAMDCI